MSFTINELNLTKRFLGRYVSVRIEANGLFVAELRGTDVSRVDAENRTLRPGEDQVVTVAGRIVTRCLVRLSGGAGGNPYGYPHLWARRCDL